MSSAQEAFGKWRSMPAPQRGEIVRQFGEKLRELKEPLGKLVSSACTNNIILWEL